MFKFHHFVAAISCAVAYVATSAEHNAYVRDRLAELDRETVAAFHDAVAIIQLNKTPAKSNEVTVTYKNGEWVMEPSQ